MKIAIYSSIGHNKGQDTEDQLAQLRSHVLERHCEVYLFVDRDSGKTSERAQFQKLLESAARRDFQVVLVWALDRFIGEGVAAVFVHIQKLLRYGVQVVSHTEPQFNTTGPAGQLMISIATWIVQQERIRISARTKAGLAKARAKGKPLGRPWKVLPLGRVAADRQRGMSWRQMERQYHVRQSTLRNALRKLAQAPMPPPPETDGPSCVGAPGEAK